MRPIASSSKPRTRCSPSSTWMPRAGSVVRALVLLVWNSAARNPRRPSITSHLPPTSNVSFFSGSVLALLTASESASAEGLNEVP